MKNLFLFLFISIPIFVFSQSVTNQTVNVRYPRNISPYAIIDLSTGDTLSWYWNKDEIISYVANHVVSISIPNTQIAFGTGTGLTSDPGFRYSTSKHSILVNNSFYLQDSINVLFPFTYKFLGGTDYTVIGDYGSLNATSIQLVDSSSKILFTGKLNIINYIQSVHNINTAGLYGIIFPVSIIDTIGISVTRDTVKKYVNGSTDQMYEWHGTVNATSSVTGGALKCYYTNQSNVADSVVVEPIVNGTGTKPGAINPFVAKASTNIYLVYTQTSGTVNVNFRLYNTN